MQPTIECLNPGERSLQISYSSTKLQRTDILFLRGIMFHFLLSVLPGLLWKHTPSQVSEFFQSSNQHLFSTAPIPCPALKTSIGSEMLRCVLGKFWGIPEAARRMQ